MSHVIVDRRLNDKDKSISNRGKFLRRTRGLLKKSVREAVVSESIKDLAKGGGKGVRIPVRGIQEPTFHHDPKKGIKDRVIPGNDQYSVGDKIKRPVTGEGGASRKGSPDGEGDDDFVFTLTKEEFRELFFENCELPDMVQKMLLESTTREVKREGFTTDGAPCALNIVRTMRYAKSRTVGLTSIKRKKLAELEQQHKELLEKISTMIEDGKDVSDLIDEASVIEAKIKDVKHRLSKVAFIDPIDLRYNNWVIKDVPTTKAVMFCVMDVSGSMSEKHKSIAKTFFLLLQLFLETEYDIVDVVFIKYHTVANITDEEDFYYGTDTGGTVSSPALERVSEQLTSNYKPSEYNIYISHASDGDNYEHDNPKFEERLRELLPVVSYYAYVQVEPAEKKTYYGMPIIPDDSLWKVFQKVRGEYANFECVVAEDPNQVYPVFKKLFERKKS